MLGLARGRPESLLGGRERDVRLPPGGLNAAGPQPESRKIGPESRGGRKTGFLDLRPLFLRAPAPRWSWGQGRPWGQGGSWGQGVSL